MKRILSTVLALMFVLSCVPVMPVNATEETEKADFNGYTAISTKEALNAIRNDLSGQYYLTCDIVFTEEDFEEGGAFYNEGNGWQPVGNMEFPFAGVFDGNGYTIQNIRIDVAMDTQCSLGLFGVVSGSVKNLGVSGDISVACAVADARIGAIAGTVSGSAVNCVNNCEISVTWTADVLTEETNLAFVGGVAGRADGILEKCTNNGTVTVSAKTVEYVSVIGCVGGVCGYLSDSGTKCLNNGAVTVETITGRNSNVAATYFAGGVCGYLKGKLQYCSNTKGVTLSDARSSKNEYEFLAGGIAAYGTTTAQVENCRNTGDIYSAARYSYTGGVLAESQGSVLRCSNTGTVFTATVTSDSEDMAVSGGIVGVASGTISECYNTGCIKWDQFGASQPTYTGGIAAILDGSVTNCYNAGHVSEDMYYGRGGGIAGRSYGTISLCYDIGASGVCAAIAGKTETAPTDCVRSEYTFLGFSGAADTSIEGTVEEMKEASIYQNFDFENVWQIDASSVYAFPTLKNNPHIVDNSDNTTVFAGGNGSVERPYLIETAQHLQNVEKYPGSNFKLIADIDLEGKEFQSFCNYGILDGNGFAVKSFSVTQVKQYGCGFVYENEGCIINLGVEDATIASSRGASWIGGIAARSIGKIMNCYFDGTVKAGGGIVGCADGPVINCINFGTITNGGGGIANEVAGSSSWAGTWKGYIKNCINFGDVSGKNAGGIVSESKEGDIINCFNMGNISGRQYAGGIVQSLSQADVINCYNAGNVVGNGICGAIAAKNSNGYAENCYYLNNMDNAGPDDLIKATALSQEQMAKKNHFRGFDFNAVWTMEGSAGYLFPELRENPFYTISFLDDNGSVFDKKFCGIGMSVESPETPTRAADETYTYTFAGWDKEVVDCAGDATYTATYTSDYIAYTVTFVDADGTELSKEIYHWGDKVTAPEDPAKAADETYTYTFAGWDKEVMDCAGDATYIATYTADHIEYVVTFQYEDGTVIKQYTLHYGDEVEPPQSPAVPDSMFIFKGWDKAVTACQGNAVYTAVFAYNHIPGDMNTDKEVNTEDVVQLLLYISMPDMFPLKEEVNADFTGDDLVTTEDAVQLLLHISMPDMFPL